MIKFFRHIRKSLLEQNKTGKYVKYAIGEIILVMIGILLALQVNNWNEERLNKVQINNYLKSLVIDLKSDIALYERNLNNHNTDIENKSFLLSTKAYKALEPDSIEVLINSYWSVSSIPNQTYAKIKSVGLPDVLGTPEIDIAVNDYYNKSVLFYYEFNAYHRRLTERDDMFWNYSSTLEADIVRVKELELGHIPYDQPIEVRKRELIKLVESTLGRNHIKSALNRAKQGAIVISRFKEDAENLVQLIEKEVKNHD